MTAVGPGELLTKITVPRRPQRRLRLGDDRRRRDLHRQRGRLGRTAACASRSAASAPTPVLVEPASADAGGRPRRGARGGPRAARRRPRVGRLPAPPRRGASPRARSSRPRKGADGRSRRASQTVSVEVNGTTYEREVEARRLLVHFLRDDLDLTGTHVGCDTGNCGACSVILDGTLVKSCMLLAVQADGASIETVEGLAAGRAS